MLYGQRVAGKLLDQTGKDKDFFHRGTGAEDFLTTEMQQRHGPAGDARQGSGARGDGATYGSSLGTTTVATYLSTSSAATGATTRQRSALDLDEMLPRPRGDAAGQLGGGGGGGSCGKGAGGVASGGRECSGLLAKLTSAMATDC